MSSKRAVCCGTLATMKTDMPPHAALPLCSTSIRAPLSNLALPMSSRLMTSTMTPALSSRPKTLCISAVELFDQLLSSPRIVMRRHPYFAQITLSPRTTNLHAREKSSDPNHSNVCARGLLNCSLAGKSGDRLWFQVIVTGGVRQFLKVKGGLVARDSPCEVGESNVVGKTWC